MKIRKKSWRKDRSLRNTTIYRFIGRTVAVYNSCYRTTRNEIREEVTERRIDFERGSLEIKALCQTLSKAFDMSSATAKDSPKPRRAEDQESESRERRSPVERFLRKPYWRSEIRLEELRCFQIFLLRIDSKTLERTEVKEIGR